MRFSVTSETMTDLVALEFDTLGHAEGKRRMGSKESETASKEPSLFLKF